MSINLCSHLKNLFEVWYIINSKSWRLSMIKNKKETYEKPLLEKHENLNENTKGDSSVPD